MRTQVQLTEEQSAALRRMAATEGVSMAEVIRQCVDERILRGRRPPDMELRRRAIAMIGAVKDGPTDMARNHDEYAAESYDS